MDKYKFKTYCEFADFGFRHDQTQAPKNDPDPGVFKPLDVEYITKSLLRLKSTTKKQERFAGELLYGEGVGSVRLQFTPFGGLKAIIRKLTKDLHGESVWICKRVVEIRHLFDDHPDKLTHELDKVINEVAGEGIDSPSNTFEETERLVLHMASKLRTARGDLFFYEGIRRTKENADYTIHFGLHGMGVQRRGQKRVDEFCVRVVYRQDKGYIQIIGQEVDGPLGRHDWRIDQAQWNEIFMPSQPMEEIIESQYHLVRSF